VGGGPLNLVREDGDMRGIFFDADDARAVLDRLVRDGFHATMERDRLAGEDDDEDHPWAIVTDAPPVVLELLVDQYDGWLDEGGEASGPAQPAAPLDLPAGPKRIKRPG